MSDNEEEIDFSQAKPSTPREIIGFFKEPIPIEQKKCIVDEAFLSAFEEMKADEKVIKKNLEIMSDAIKSARMGKEKTVTCGKLVAFFTDVEGAPSVDWEALARAELGNDKGEVDKATVAKYTTPGKTQVRLAVRRIG
jgi:hypothetical protein